MAANTDKTVSLRITHKKNPLDHVYKMGSVPLKQVDSYKYLGVTFTANLSWNLHVENTCSAAFRKLAYLRHKLRNSPSNVKLLAYLTYIRPKLEYACVAWDPYTKLNINKLERIQRKSVRFIYSKYKRSDSPSQLMLANEIPSLESRRQKYRLDFLHNLIDHKFTLNSSLYVSPLSTRQTRHHHSDALTPIYARTDTYKFSFFPRTISEWYSLHPPYNL